MNTLKKATVYGLAALCLLACKPGQDTTEQKIDALLSKMTLKEKIGQMNQLTGLGLAEDMQGAIRNGDVGSILNELDLATTNKL